MKTKCLIIFIYFVTLICKAQPDITWQENYGGSGVDFAYSIVHTNDGGFVMAGYALSDGGNVTDHNGQRDFWIVKSDAQGVLQWEKAYGGNNAETAYSIKQTNDNGFIVTGVTASVNGDITENFGYDDIWILKLDASGNLEWQKSYGDGDTERAWEILQTSDGGYVLAGYSWLGTSHKEGIVIKIDAAGNIEWQNLYSFDNNGNNEEFHSIKQTSDGGYIVAGETFVFEELVNPPQYWVIKLNAMGDIEWNKRYGGTNIDSAWHVQQTTDNGYIVLGYSYSNDEDVSGNHGLEDIWVIKLDSNGNIQWGKSLGGSQHDRAYSIIQMVDGNYLVAGYSDSNDGDVTTNQGSYDGWLIKLDTSGNIIWQKSVGGSSFDIFRSVIQTTDGGFAVAGRTDSSDTAAGTLQGDGDYWLVKFDAESLSTQNSNFLENSISLYPNPTSDIVTIKSNNHIHKVKLHTLKGQLVIEKTDSNHIECAELASGVYVMHVYLDNQLIVKRLIIK
ncbi:MAG: T9SS type A sorting domain-containing protein [Algicola sp.]|nr:T9SS type A sorting domain-containing protein [Algicola sp.]